MESKHQNFAVFVSVFLAVLAFGCAVPNPNENQGAGILELGIRWTAIERSLVEMRLAQTPMEIAPIIEAIDSFHGSVQFFLDSQAHETYYIVALRRISTHLRPICLRKFMPLRISSLPFVKP